MKHLYTQSESDLSAMMLEMVFGNKIMKWIAYAVGFSFLISLISEFALNGFSLEGLLSWLLPISLIGGIYYALHMWSVKRAVKYPSQGVAFVGSKSIELLNNKVILSGENYSTALDLSAITELKENANYFFVKSNRSVLACIPKSTFSDDQKLIEFREQFD